MSRALLCAVLLCIVCVVPCSSVLSKTIVGTCCNGEEATYAAQEAWAGQRMYVVGSYGEFCESSFYDWSFGVILGDWNHGRITHYTLSAQTSNGCNNYVPDDPNTYIMNGGYDTQIGYLVQHLITFFKGPDGVMATSDDRRMYFRLQHEMSGNWYSWSNGAANYAQAWRHVWTKIMVGTGITHSHIQWVFEPTAPHENHDFIPYWPGDQYVDWLSLDGYNSNSAQSWYQPAEVFDTMLYKLRDFRPNLPVMISETGSYSAGGSRVADKAQWLLDLMPYLAKWNVQIVLYFNVINGDDWPVFSDASNGVASQHTLNIKSHNWNVIDTWKTVLQNTYQLANPNSPRIMTDDEFQGRLTGYATAPAKPQNLVIYNNGANYYDWQCTPAPYPLNLQSTAQKRSGETYSMSLNLSPWGNVQFHSFYGANTLDYIGGAQFYIYTTQNNVALNVRAFTDAGDLPSFATSIPSAYTWTLKTFTWAQLSVPAGAILKGFYVQGASNSDQGAAYFDGVQLIAGDPHWTLTPPTPAPTPAPTPSPTPSSSSVCVGPIPEYSNAATITCPQSSQKIAQINYASFGTTPTGICGTFAPTSCNDPTASFYVTASNCLNRNSCTLQVSTSTFGDPCPYTGKFFAAQVTCSSASPSTVCASNVGEGATVSLTCPSSSQHIVAVQFASYGTATGSCGSFQTNICHASTSTTVTSKNCLNKNSCSFTVNNDAFGDPCSGVGKHLNVQVQCL